MYFGNKFYPYYPKIREDQFRTDTSNIFIDTMRLSNLHLKAMGGDFDGDTVTVKGVYTEEANEEIDRYMNTKIGYIGFGGEPLKHPGDDLGHSLFSLTRVLSDANITKTENIKYTAVK